MTALADLFRDVQADMAAAEISPLPNQVFGRNEAVKQVNQGPGRANRIVWHEGAPNGAAGEEVAPRGPGQVPRSLKDQLVKFTVYVWGWDAASPNDELAQYEAAQALFMVWRAAVFLRAEGRVTVSEPEWRSPNNVERKFGRELRVVCTIRQPVTDAAFRDLRDAAPLSSSFDVTEQGETDTVTTTAP